MTRHRIAQFAKKVNPKSPENRHQTRRFLRNRLLYCRRLPTHRQSFSRSSWTTKKGDPFSTTISPKNSGCAFKKRLRPEIPKGLSDRFADNVRILHAIADVARGTWPERARRGSRPP